MLYSLCMQSQHPFRVSPALHIYGPTDGRTTGRMDYGMDGHPLHGTAIRTFLYIHSLVLNVSTEYKAANDNTDCYLRSLCTVKPLGRMGKQDTAKNHFSQSMRRMGHLNPNAWQYLASTLLLHTIFGQQCLL